jgi:hypothetical protein
MGGQERSTEDCWPAADTIAEMRSEWGAFFAVAIGAQTAKRVASTAAWCWDDEHAERILRWVSQSGERRSSARRAVQATAVNLLQPGAGPLAVGVQEAH